MSGRCIIVRGVHEAASQFFLYESLRYDLHSRNKAQALVPLGSMGYDLRDGTVHPDQSFVADGGVRANVMLEVGDSQSVESLHRRAARLLTESDGGIAMVVAVKIYGPPNAGAMAVFVYLRRARADEAVVPVEAVSFGPLAMRTAQVDELVRNTGIDRKNLRGFFDNENYPNNEACTKEKMQNYSLVVARNCLVGKELRSAQNTKTEVIGCLIYTSCSSASFPH